MMGWTVVGSTVWLATISDPLGLKLFGQYFDASLFGQPGLLETQFTHFQIVASCKGNSRMSNPARNPTNCHQTCNQKDWLLFGMHFHLTRNPLAVEVCIPEATLSREWKPEEALLGTARRRGRR